MLREITVCAFVKDESDRPWVTLTWIDHDSGERRDVTGCPAIRVAAIPAFMEELWFLALRHGPETVGAFLRRMDWTGPATAEPTLPGV